MDRGRPRWRSRVWLVVAGVLAVVLFALLGMGVDPPDRAWIPVLGAVTVVAAVLSWAAVRVRAERRRYDDELAQWAAERAAHAERLRIAGDLHDLVSHGLGLITVRAAVARHLDGPAGERERAHALEDIERTSRETTTELRRMLGVLRSPGDAPLAPAADASDLPRIVAAANAAGLDTDLDAAALAGSSRGAQLTVCAIVREALNNTLRHAGPTTAHVRIARTDELIVVEVRDAGPRAGWTPHPGAGHGLDGLRERVAFLDGTLRSGRDEHGFRLEARFADRVPR